VSLLASSVSLLVLGTSVKIPLQQFGGYEPEQNLWQTLNLDYHKNKYLTRKLNEHSIRHVSALIETRYALQYNTSNNSQGLGLGATAHNPPDSH
jgi:hypothetical protein